MQRTKEDDIVFTMTDTRALRWSAWTLFAMGVGHMVSHIVGLGDLVNPKDEATRAAVVAMKNQIVSDPMGDRSMLEFYLGFSIFLAAATIIIAALVLMAIRLMKDDAAQLRRFARIYLAGTFVMTVISIKYFILAPTVFLLVAFGLAAFATARLRKTA